MRATNPLAAAGRGDCARSACSSLEMREYLHTLYQFTDPWVVDDTKFRAAFGDRSTPLGEALDTTLDWYRSRAAVPAH